MIIERPQATILRGEMVQLDEGALMRDVGAACLTKPLGEWKIADYIISAINSNSHIGRSLSDHIV